MTIVRTMAILLALLSCAGCNKNTQSMLPTQLDGFWITDTPRYESRFLELSEAFVIVGTGPDNLPSVQMIDKVTNDPMQKDLALTIYSTDLEGAHYELALQFSPANGGEIRFPHQKQVWRRYSDKPGTASTSLCPCPQSRQQTFHRPSE